MNRQISIYLFAFTVSLATHFSLLSGTTQFLSYPKKIPIPINKHNPIKMRFVDSIQNNQTDPVKPTDLISDKSNTASQPKAPPIEEFKQIKTVQNHTVPGQNIPSYQPERQTPLSSNSDSTERPKNKKQTKNKQIKEIFEKKEIVIQKKFVAPAKQTAKQTAKTEEKTDSPKTDKPKIADKTASKPDSCFQGEQPSKYQPAETGKIDELIQKAQTDEKVLEKLLDELTFNVKKHHLGEYWARVKRKISRNWQTRMLPYSSELFESKATIIFKISADGSLTYIESIGSYGNPFFIKDCESSITDSAKFEPLPKDYMRASGKKELWVYMTFWYNFGS